MPLKAGISLKTPVSVPSIEALQLLGQNQHSKVARWHAKGDAELEDPHDLLHRGTEPQRRLDVPARARCVQVSDGRIAGYALQLGQLGRKDVAYVDRGARGEERFRPCRV
jgi:hypothetical protein